MKKHFILYKGQWQVLIFFSIFGFVFWIAGAYEYSQIRELKKYGRKATGVVDSVYTYTYEGKTTRYIVSFLFEKQKISIENRFAIADRRYQKGDRVAILYLEEAPHEARIYDFKEMHLIWICLMAIGFGIVGIPVLIMAWNNRK